MNTLPPALRRKAKEKDRVIQWETLGRWNLNPLNSDAFEGLSSRARVLMLGLLCCSEPDGTVRLEATRLAELIFPFSPPFVLNELFELEKAGFIDCQPTKTLIRNIANFLPPLRLERNPKP